MKMNNWQIRKFEEELDELNNKCIHVFLEKDERVVTYCRIVPQYINWKSIGIKRIWEKRYCPGDY